MRNFGSRNFPPVLFRQGCRLTIGCLAGGRLGGCSSVRFPSQAKPSQAKVLTGGGDLREAQADVPLPQ